MNELHVRDIFGKLLTKLIYFLFERSILIFIILTCFLNLFLNLSYLRLHSSADDDSVGSTVIDESARKKIINFILNDSFFFLKIDSLNNFYNN